MKSFSSWLNNHQYKLCNDCLFKNKLPKIRDLNDGSVKLLKVLDLSELDGKVVNEVVDTMNKINYVHIKGLIKYKIIEIYDKNLYRVMKEYKINLAEIDPVKYFEETGPFDVLQGIIQCLLGLDENQTFHSDLKPSNIFITNENEVIISDYCNNSLYKGKEDLLYRRGKDLCFVCVDELLGKEIDISSDIWNFGLILYYIRSGNYPFYEKSMLEILENIKNVKYSQLQCDDNDKRINNFLTKIIRKEKKNRLKLNELVVEFKKLNEPELPTIQFDKDKVMELLKQNKQEELIPYFQMMLGFNYPNNIKAVLNIMLGSYYMRKDRYEEALSSFTAALKLTTKDFDIERCNYGIANYYFAMKKYEESIPYFKAALEHATTKEAKMNDYSGLGGCYFALKEYEESLKYHLLSLEFAENEDIRSIQQYNISECYYELGENEKSLEYLNKAKEISKCDYTNFLYNEIKGKYAWKNKEKEEAKACCETALDYLKVCEGFTAKEREEKQHKILSILEELNN